MQFLRRAGRRGSVMALLPGAWNPPTRAHVALAMGALEHAEEVVFVLPRAFPHKGFDGPPPEVRAHWIQELSRKHDAFSAALTEGGLFVEMAREARREGASRVWLVSGADAAERIATWNYAEGEEIERQLQSDYGLLVAPRLEPWTPPERLAGQVRTLPLEAELQAMSSTRVRQQIGGGGQWRHMVPEELQEAIAAAYGCS